MCGITGFLSETATMTASDFYSAHLTLRHRGPDDEGFIAALSGEEPAAYRGDDTSASKSHLPHISDMPPSNIMMGHRRLSIIDLSDGGHQPFSFNGLHMVFNGEIFNYIELREELKSFGYSFSTKSDTEVFIKAFHLWGTSAFSRLNGMWAAAIYSRNDGSLTLSRDRFGIKPLYYFADSQGIAFGSEIRFLTAIKKNAEPNEKMIYEYLRFSRLDHTDETMFAGVKQIEPSHFAVYKNGILSASRYWDIPEIECKQDETKALLVSAIRLRMRSDVEVGSLLSGGIDSNTIVGLIDKNRMTDRLNTFSAVFRDEDFSEKRYIEDVSPENVHISKHFIYPEAQTLPETIEELLKTQEEPFRSLSVFSQFEIYKYISANTKTTVLLNGQGADEIFTGYTKTFYSYLAELLRTMHFRKLISELSAFAEIRKTSILKTAAEAAKSFISDRYPRKDKYGIFLKDFQPIIFRKKFLDMVKNDLANNLSFSALREYLHYEDRNSMRFSLESRLPYLDYRLVEHVMNLDTEYKISNGVSKTILRDIASGAIPTSVLNRRDKSGFVSPQEIWQKKELLQEFDKAFRDIETNGLFSFTDHKRISALYSRYKSGKLKDWAFIWRIYCLYKWKNIWFG